MSGNDSRFSALGKTDEDTQKQTSEDEPIEGANDVSESVEDDTTQPPGPPFSFDEAQRETLYGLPETWASLRRLFDVDVKPSLIRDYELENIQRREFHEAVAQLAIKNPEALAEIVADQRGVELDEDD